MEKLTLTWQDLRGLGTRDKAGRFDATDAAAIEYINANGYRTPSRAWPYSHAKPLLTRKFAKWLMANYPAKAAELKLTGAK